MHVYIFLGKAQNLEKKTKQAEAGKIREEKIQSCVWTDDPSCPRLQLLNLEGKPYSNQPYPLESPSLYIVKWEFSAPTDHSDIKIIKINIIININIIIKLSWP